MKEAELKKLLEYHDDLYYNQDVPEISDEAYNALKEKYKKLTGGEYDYVPGKASGSLQKVEHSHAIKSLDKVHTEDEVRAAITRLWPVIIEPKFDGLTVVGYPGTTTSAGVFATRGNGKIGENITHTAIKMDGINRVEKIDYPVRMEAMILKSTFAKLNEDRIARGEEPFKNPRNAVAGMLRHKDASKVTGVDYFAYNIVGSELTQTQQLGRLSANGFTITEWAKFDYIEDAVAYVMNFEAKYRDNLPYEIDGLVIKSDIPNSHVVFGETGHHPKNAVAFKFPSKGKWTTLNEVIWQVKRTGKITPVAEFMPVDLDGTTVTRATLHNEAICDALGVRIGGDIFIERANDVIPAVIEAKHSPLRNTFPVVAPTHCPECNSVVVRINDQHFCECAECPAKAVGRIVHLAKRDALDIEGLSEETAQKMYDAGVINPFWIFDLTAEKIERLPGFAKRSAIKLYDAIQAVRSTELKRFLYAASVPGIGRSVSEDIANTFGTIESFIEDAGNDFAKTRKIEGVGDILINNMIEHGYLWGNLLEHVTPRPATVVAKPDKVLTFVITGTLEHPRSYYENIIKGAGHKTSGSVSKKTSYVLVGEEAGSKLDTARDLGIKQLTNESELKAVLGI